MIREVIRIQREKGSQVMIRQIWIAECDLCGHTEKAKAKSGRYNETDYTLPDGWCHGHNQNFLVCPECLARLSGREGEKIVESYG